MKLGKLVGLGSGHIVLDGDPAPLLPKGHSLHRITEFSAHIYCGQMAGWIKMPLGREVGLDQSNIVLEGTQLPPKRCTAPSFRSVSIVVTVAHPSYC